LIASGVALGEKQRYGVILFVTAGEIVVGDGGIVTVELLLVLLTPEAVPPKPTLDVAPLGVTVVPLLVPMPVEDPGTISLAPAVPDGAIEVVPPADVVRVDGVVPDTVPPEEGLTAVLPEVETAAAPVEMLRVVEPGPLTLLPVEVDDVVVEGVGAGPVPSPEPATPAKTFVSYFRVFSNSRACSSRTFSSLSTAARSIRSSLCSGVRQLCNSQPFNITQTSASTTKPPNECRLSIQSQFPNNASSRQWGTHPRMGKKFQPQIKAGGRFGKFSTLALQVASSH